MNKEHTVWVCVNKDGSPKWAVINKPTHDEVTLENLAGNKVIEIKYEFGEEQEKK